MQANIQRRQFGRLTNLRFMTFVVWRTRIAQYVIAGGALLLVAAAIALQLYLVGHAYAVVNILLHMTTHFIHSQLGNDPWSIYHQLGNDPWSIYHQLGNDPWSIYHQLGNDPWSIYHQLGNDPWSIQHPTLPC